VTTFVTWTDKKCQLGEVNLDVIRGLLDLEDPLAMIALNDIGFIVVLDLASDTIHGRAIHAVALEAEEAHTHTLQQVLELEEVLNLVPIQDLDILGIAFAGEGIDKHLVLGWQCAGLPCNDAHCGLLRAVSGGMALQEALGPL